jgi:hypothetical protein
MFSTLKGTFYFFFAKNDYVLTVTDAAPESNTIAIFAPSKKIFLHKCSPSQKEHFIFFVASVTATKKIFFWAPVTAGRLGLFLSLLAEKMGCRGDPSRWPEAR